MEPRTPSPTQAASSQSGSQTASHSPSANSMSTLSPSFSTIMDNHLRMQCQCSNRRAIGMDQCKAPGGRCSRVFQQDDLHTGGTPGAFYCFGCLAANCNSLEKELAAITSAAIKECKGQVIDPRPLHLQEYEPLPWHADLNKVDDDDATATFNYHNLDDIPLDIRYPLEPLEDGEEKDVNNPMHAMVDDDSHFIYEYPASDSESSADSEDGLTDAQVAEKRKQEAEKRAQEDYTAYLIRRAAAISCLVPCPVDPALLAEAPQAPAQGHGVKREIEGGGRGGKMARGGRN